MAGENLRLPPFEQNVDYYILTLFERLETMRKESNGENQRPLYKYQTNRKMQMEVRTLEFWRSVISECLGSFLYVFIVCGAAAGAGVGASVSSVLLATALASGLAMATLTQCFMQTSGAHINPAVTLASCVIRSISPFRAAMYITAQCGGSIAGAALLYGVTVPGYQGNLQTTISHSASLPAWERFGVEFILTFVVVLSYFISTDSFKRLMGHSTTAIGCAYGACSFVSMPFLNPARSLGPSFVLNKWDNHWVYWFGPLVGGVASGIVYEYIFNSRRNTKSMKASSNNESSSLQSAAEFNLNQDIEKSNVTTKYPGIFQRNDPPSNGHNVDDSRNLCSNLYSAQPVTNYDQTEPLYSGTRSMYCRSPTLPRNLNRSQSVYAKSNSAINREIFDRTGPLVPAQSLCPMRGRNQVQAQNQNLQNQMQQRTETVYGIQEPSRQNQNQHHLQQHQNQNQQTLQHTLQQQQDHPQQRSHPVESVYGPPIINNRGQSAQSDDSSYGSYHGSAMTPISRNNNNGTSSVMMYGPLTSHSGDNHHGSYIRTQSERKISPPVVSHSDSAAAMPNTFPTNQRPPISERHPQQQMYMHHQQQYEMLPVRHK